MKRRGKLSNKIKGSIKKKELPCFDETSQKLHPYTAITNPENICLIDDKNKLLQMSEISLWLDTYDDIFSDFDPRPFSHRALSVDFLDEAKRASLDKNLGKIEIRFLIPAKMRNFGIEEEIKRRLHDHFLKHHRNLIDEHKKTKKAGYRWFGIGVILLVFGGILYSYADQIDVAVHGFLANLGMNILIMIFEPAGWFLAWEGLDQVFFDMKHKKAELEFYEKMSKAEIHFTSY